MTDATTYFDYAGMPSRDGVFEKSLAGPLRKDADILGSVLRVAVKVWARMKDHDNVVYVHSAICDTRWLMLVV